MSEELPHCKDKFGTWTCDKEGRLVHFEANENVTEIEIPSVVGGIPVKSIATGWFPKNKVLKKIIIPDGVEKIEPKAFENFVALKEVNIPESVRFVCDYAFCHCASLKELIIPEGVIAIGEGAFGGCIALKKVDIPENVMLIGVCAFACCFALKKVIIPEGVKEVSAGAFASCTSLGEVTIAKGVKVNYLGAFQECTALEKLIISDLSNNNFEAIKRFLSASLPHLWPRKSITITLKEDAQKDISFRINNREGIDAFVKAYFKINGIDLEKNRTEINTRKGLGSAGIVAGSLSVLISFFLAPAVATVIALVGAAFLIAGSIVVHRARKRGNAQDYFVAANKETKPDIAEIGEKTVAFDFKLSPWYNEKGTWYDKARGSRDIDELNEILIPTMLGQEEQIEP